MLDIEFGRLLRTARIRLGLRQRDVAQQAGVSQALVSRVERGHPDTIALHFLRRIAAAVGVSVELRGRTSGVEAARLLDRDHAALVEFVISRLQATGWEASPELTFSVYGERGSIDVCGFYARSGALLVVEVKPLIDDLQDLLSTLDRKARLAPGLVAERGWKVRGTSRLVVALASAANRATVARHSSVFEASLPMRNLALKAWLRRPSTPVRGLWLVRPQDTRVGATAVRGRTRVRLPRPDKAPTFQ